MYFNLEQMLQKEDDPGRVAKIKKVLRDIEEYKAK